MVFRFGRQTKNGARNLFLIVGALTIASLVGFFYLYPTNQPAAYFLMPSRFWEMAAGCLLFIGFQKRSSIVNSREGATSSGDCVDCGCDVFTDVHGICIHFRSGCFVFHPDRFLEEADSSIQGFSNPKVVYIGLISYSLYLWHWGVLSISRWTIGIHWWSVPFLVALMLGLAIASYRWIETPLRKGNWFGRRWKTLVVGGGTLLTLSGGLVALGKPLKGDFTLRLRIRRTNHSLTQFADRNDEYNGNNCHLEQGRIFEISSMENCKLRSGAQKNTFYFAGNSHTNHYRNLHHKLHTEHDVGIFSISISTCLFAGEQIKGCKNAQSIIEHYILDKLNKNDTVVISNRYITNSDKHSKDLSDYTWMTTKESINKINTFASKVSAKGANTILFLPTPEFEGTIQTCKPVWFRPSNTISCPYKPLKDAKKETEKLHFLLKEYLSDDIIVYDPMPVICKNEICSIIDHDQKPLFVDDDHLTDYANSEYVYPDFISFLRSNILLGESN